MAPFNRNILQSHKKYIGLLIFLTVVSPPLLPVNIYYYKYKPSMTVLNFSHITKHHDLIQPTIRNKLDSDNHHLDPAISTALVISNEQQGSSRTEPGGRSLRNSSSSILIKTLQSTKRIIDTPGCFLPMTSKLPERFRMRKNTNPYCGFEKRLVKIDDTSEILRIKSEEHRSDCTFIEIKQEKTNRDSFANGDTVPLTENFNISRHELFATKCGNHINLDAHFPINQKIQEKIEHWKNNKEPPISVLFMGFDTTSRQHYHRSLLDTLPLMKKMGFVDFKGYHSIEPYTLANLLAFMTGMSAPSIRATFTPDWRTSFDACPLIWKSFSHHKYVTMYVEDGDGSFHWAGKGGFKNKPTDYFPRPLFKSAKEMRKRLQGKLSRSPDKDTCMSTMNPQKFILNYNTRFLKKFSTTVPFFSFSWFAYPFHDSSYSLRGFDEQLFKFFKFLNSSEAERMRENTLIILNADHGDKSNEFIKSGYVSFIERSLPGLFIRLPENLLKRYPDLHAMQNLQTNSGRLVGGFDIHHTLLHLLHMQGLNSITETADGDGEDQTTTPFEPVLSDRSSLFVPVSEHRTCADINVVEGNCVCNVSSESIEIENPIFTDQLISYALVELNAIINSSQYRNVCHEHAKPMIALISASIVSQTDASTDTLLRFVTNPKNAQFEIQLRVHQEDQVSSLNRIERIGQFHRLNLYGDSSWCVAFVTDEDKRMKEICDCKGDIPKEAT